MPPAENARVIDAHIHIQPWDMLRSQVRETMRKGRDDWDDIQACIREWEQLGSAPGAMVRMREVYERKLKETRDHVMKLRALEHELQASLKYLDTCDECDPARLLSACNGCDLHGCEERAPELVAGFHARSS